MGRVVTGADDPVVLYVSGGNTQVNSTELGGQCLQQLGWVIRGRHDDDDDEGGGGGGGLGIDDEVRLTGYVVRSTYQGRSGRCAHMPVCMRWRVSRARCHVFTGPQMGRVSRVSGCR